MELKFINYEHKDKNISFNINPATIYGITGTGKEDFLDLISLKKLNKGQLSINDEKVTKDLLNKYRRQISYVEKNLKTHHPKVLNLMNDHIIRNNLLMKDSNKKIRDSLKIVGLEEEILQKEICYLSASERKLIQIALSLLSNPEVIILDDPFKFLDKKTEKTLVILFQRLKEQFEKTIIISTDDSRCLYQYTTEMFFLKNNDIILLGPTNEVYLRVDFLKRHKLEIPEIVEFTYIAKKKKEVKIDYHKDVRDIIKDIYKHI